MTLEEAIKHAEGVAEEQEGRGYCDRSVCVIMDENNHNCDECEVVKCRECAKEHMQLAEWLKDYKRLLEQETPQPKMGHWIRMKAYEKWECSECHTAFRFTFKEHDYCPNCGCKMSEVQDE